MIDLQTIIRTSAELGANMALEKAGITAGEISKKEALRRYGTYFRNASDAGRILPVRKGPAANSTKFYRIADILALRAADEAAAYLIENQHQSTTI